MKHLSSVLVFAVLLGLSADYAQAQQKKLEFGAVMFGRTEEIDKIQDLEGTEYKLSHKYTLYFFIAGVYLSDDGYVLQKRADTNAYYPLSEDEIRKSQKEGLLPSPLPKYSIPILQYLFGYSLWIIIAFVVGGPVLRHIIRRLMGNRFCPKCKLEMTPHESKTRICGVCRSHL